MNSSEFVKLFQQRNGLGADGIPGPKTLAVLDALCPPPGGAVSQDWHTVKASSFADPEDVRRFKACKATGKSDQECFKVGDNGIGKWGDDTTANRPMCALPPEDWQPLGSKARGAKVMVQANGRVIICELRDTMPKKANIKNGAGIDLNPAAVAKLGMKPPIMVTAKWKFA